MKSNQTLMWGAPSAGMEGEGSEGAARRFGGDQARSVLWTSQHPGMYSAYVDHAWTSLRTILGRAEPPRVLSAGAAAVFTVATAANAAALPDRDFWSPGSWATFVLLATGVVAGFAGIRNSLLLTRRSAERNLEEACVQLAAYIDERCDTVSLRDVGVHTWRVAGPPLGRRLHRGPSFLLRTRQPSHVTFTRGKGVIGLAWRDRAKKLVDLSEFHAQLGEGRAIFDGLPPSARFNFEWDEYTRTKRYMAIWAAPLFKGGDFGGPVVGVISVDIQTPGAFSELQTAVEGSPGPELEAILAACETALSD